ncbi:MAG: hypothetical protein GY866_42090 [Proteobacteria bacterium]|nr:hypothetical protein [Pseudomonadota bacterium]
MSVVFTRVVVRIVLRTILVVFPAFVGPSILAVVESVEINGTYIEGTRTFKGEIAYIIAGPVDDRLLFHLPPNRYAKPDERKAYHLTNLEGEKGEVPRGDLRDLKAFRLRNAHLPRKIAVSRVRCNGESVAYKIKDNPDLPPLRNAENALLEVKPPPKRLRLPARITIGFTTEFGSLPGGYKRLLWNYTPRLVARIDGKWDLGDNLQPVYPVKSNVNIISSTSKKKAEVLNLNERVSVPILPVDGWDLQYETFWLSTDDYFQDKTTILLGRITRVLRFLFDDRWISKNGDPFRFVVWDGGLSVTGRYVLLPRRLFRYHYVYYKVFEVSLINGIVESALRNGYLLDRRKDPWILPAIQAEIVRSYFKKTYQGNSFLFPWINWLNPDFFTENTVKVWLNEKLDKTLISAASTLDSAYSSHLYHPWHAKGFHLLRTIYTGEREFEKETIPKIKSVLQTKQDRPIRLTPERFFDIFAADSTGRKVGQKWLSVAGTVDYGIGQVAVEEIREGVRLELQLDNTGTLSPAVEIEFVYADEKKERRLVKNGAGNHLFMLPSYPEQITVDPDYHLLEENLLDNSWDLPIKIRPFWDFPSANRWVFTITPLIGGNALDQNLLGLNFDLRYLERTSLQLDVWKRGKDNETLWESTIYHIGFPFKNSQLYLEISQLNAANTASVGLLQMFGGEDSDVWANLLLWNEELQSIEGEPVPPGQEEWTGLELSGSVFPYEGAFSEWKLELSTNYAVNHGEPELEYHQKYLQQTAVWLIDSFDLHLGSSHGLSQGTVPLHKMYPLGGPEGLPGFPRETDLLFYRRDILEIGTQMPPLFTHTNLNLGGLVWLQRVVPILNFHWGQGASRDDRLTENLKDMELQFHIYGELLNMYEGSARLAVAQPLDNEKYKDYRIILFSNWVF